MSPNAAWGVDEGIAIARRHALAGLNSEGKTLTAAFIRKAHLHGLSVIAWTVDGPALCGSYWCGELTPS
jgi:hypothetical protein